jgi:hypothetical protein
MCFLYALNYRPCHLLHACLARKNEEIDTISEGLRIANHSLLDNLERYGYKDIERKRTTYHVLVIHPKGYENRMYAEYFKALYPRVGHFDLHTDVYDYYSKIAAYVEEYEGTDKDSVYRLFDKIVREKVSIVHPQRQVIGVRDFDTTIFYLNCIVIPKTEFDIELERARTLGLEHAKAVSKEST